MSGSDGQMPRWTHKSLMIVIATMGTTAVQPYVWATPYAWNVAAGGNWSDITAAGWNTLIAGNYPSAAGDTATFNKNITAAQAVNIDVTDATIAALTLTDSASTIFNWTIGTTDAVNNKLTFDNGGSAATISSTTGSNTISGPVVLNSNLAATVSGTALTMSSIVEGAGGLTKSGTGILSLNAANSYAGATSVLAGELRLGVAAPSGTNGALGNATSDVLIGDTSGNAAATLRTTTNVTVGRSIVIQSGNTGTATVGTTITTNSSTFNGTLTLGSTDGDGHGVTLTTGGFGTLRYGGVIQDPSGMTPGTAGVVTYGASNTNLILSGNNTFSGGLTHNNGVLSLAHAHALGTGTFTINGGTLSGTTSQTNNNPIVIGGNFSFNNNLSGTSISLGNGNVSLTGNRTITAVILTLTIGGAISDGGLGHTLTYQGSNSGFSNGLTLNGLNIFSGGLTFNPGTSSSNTLGIGNLGTSVASALGTGTFTVNSGAATARFNNSSGAAGTLLTNNPQIYNGNFNFLGSQSLNMGTGAVTLGNIITATITANTLTLGGGVGDGGNGFGLTKAGAGTLVLEGHNTYTGDTTVNAGTLTFASNGSLLMDINDASYSKLLGTGTLNLDGTLRLDVTGVTGEGTWMLVSANTLNEIYGSSFAVALAGSTDTPFAESDNIWTLMDGSNAWTFTESTGELSLAIVIPEPATMALIGLACALLVPARRGARCGGLFH